MLEAQLDLLSKIVLQDHPDNPLALALRGNSTLDIHSEEKLLTTIKNQKSYLRNIQQEYFANRGDALNSDPSN